MGIRRVVKIRELAHAVARSKARRAGVEVGNGVYLSMQGRCYVGRGARIVFGEDVSLFHNYHFEAQEGAEIHLGARVHFGEGARILATPGARVIIGEDCWFNHDVAIVARSEIVIGANCLFGPRCYLSDNNHQIARDRLIREQSFDTTPLHIGSDVWLGVGVAALKGAQIGDGAVLAASAVVNKPVPPYEIWGGIPARRISERR